jgi:hypothetical protein
MTDDEAHASRACARSIDHDSQRARPFGATSATPPICRGIERAVRTERAAFVRVSLAVSACARTGMLVANFVLASIRLRRSRRVAKDAWQRLEQ